MRRNRVVFFGTRGSLPVGGADFQLFGGDSACILAQLGGESILLDAGSGLLRAEPQLSQGVAHILLSHAHVDHIIGLPSFPPLYDPGRSFWVMAARRGGLAVREQIATLMAEPLWPTGADSFAADVRWLDLPERFSIGPVQIETMEGDHPGGASVIRLSCDGISVVYCTDFEHGPRTPALERFAAGADLLIYDAHFTADEYEEKRGWGHSTWQEGVRLAHACEARRLILTHHHPDRTDEMLLALERLLPQDIACSFARAGEEVPL